MCAVGVLILVGLSACKGPDVKEIAFDENDTLPLVMTLPADTGRYLKYQHIELTDSLVCVFRLIPTGSGNFKLMLCRYPYSEPDNCDTLLLSFPTPDTLLWGAFVMSGTDGYGFRMCGFGGNISLGADCARLPNPAWILLPFSLGDSSDIMRLGKVESPKKKTSKSKYDRLQGVYNYGFYVVDVHSPYPRTVASIRGEAQYIADPYLLLFTGYQGFTFESNCRYEESELMVIDARDMSVVAQRSMFSDLDSVYYDPDAENRSTITRDGKFLFVERDEMTYNLVHYFPQFRTLIDEKSLYDISFGLLHFVWFVRGLNPMFRSYLVVEKSVLDLDLSSDNTVHRKLLVPIHLLYMWPCNFLGAEGETVFITDPSYVEYGPFYIELPTISNLEGPPLELRWFRRMLPFSFPWHWEVSWMMSKEGRWLVAFTHLEKGDEYKEILKFKPGNTYLIPTEELSYPESERKKPNVVELPKGLYTSNFLPGEDWVVVYGPDFSFIRLFHIPGGRLLPLKAPGEGSCRDCFFSSDGRYIAYTCQIEGKEGYWLQVRRMP